MDKVSNKKHYLKQKKYFQQDLKIYEDYNENLNAWRLSYIKRINESLLDKNFKSKILIDLGTGSGYVALSMAQKGLKVFACDIAPQAISNLNLHKKNFKLKNLYPIKCFAEDIPLPDSSVDYIVSNAILEHIPNEEKAIFEWKRILKKGGKIFIVVPIKYRFIWPIFWPLNYINDRMVGHLRRYDAEDLKRKFDLKVKKIYYTGHFIKTVWVILSRFLAFNIRSNSILDNFFEKIDQKLENKRYGSSNVTMVLEKKL